MLFDAPLQMKFHEASRQGRDYDMSQIFSGTLVEADPFHAVTLVTNHDTQPCRRWRRRLSLVQTAGLCAHSAA
jgi:hypothetical protein